MGMYRLETVDLHYITLRSLLYLFAYFLFYFFSFTNHLSLPRSTADKWEEGNGKMGIVIYTGMGPLDGMLKGMGGCMGTGILGLRFFTRIMHNNKRHYFIRHQTKILLSCNIYSPARKPPVRPDSKYYELLKGFTSPLFPSLSLEQNATKSRK